MTAAPSAVEANVPAWASLRRVDWRFLLPLKDGVFRKLVLLGGPTGLEKRLVQEGIAQEASTELSQEQPADVVAALSGANVNLNQAISCLEPGGVFFIEVDRRLRNFARLFPMRLILQLQNAGLTPSGVYLAAPNFAHCRRYIPLDVPGALDWYLSTLYLAGSPAMFLIQLATRLPVGIGSLVASIAPCYAVVAVKGEREQNKPSVLGLPGLPNRLQNHGLRPALLTSGQDDGSRAIFLPFTPGSCQPAAVIKISTIPRFNPSTEREQAILSELSSRLKGKLSQTTPQPMGLYQYGDLAVSIESYATGKPIVVSSGRWRVSKVKQINDLKRAVDWLIQYYCQFPTVNEPWNEIAVTRWIEEPLTRYTATFGQSEGLMQLFEKVRQKAKALIGERMPFVSLHYDFGPWNIYRTRKDFTVIDWEFGRNMEHDRVGPSLYDLLYFTTYWVYVVRRLNNPASELDGFYKLYIQPDWGNVYVKAAREGISTYLKELKINPHFLPIMVVYLWVEQALYQFYRKRTLGGHSGLQPHNQSIRYLDMIANHPEQFFINLESS